MLRRNSRLNNSPKGFIQRRKKRGADPHVPSTSRRKHPLNSKEQKLEQGLEESMAGSDPVSITQPGTPIAEKPKDDAETRDDDFPTDAARG
jgi:hypothetical protein